MRPYKKLTAFRPLIDRRSKLLILGTMPGTVSLAKRQSYGHPQNQFWRVIFAIFGVPFERSYAKRKKFLLANGIALWDVLAECRRRGSGDAEIRDGKPADFASLFRKYPGLRVVAFNGSGAEKLFRKYGLDAGPRECVVLPSTSPRNTQSLKEKVKMWRIVKRSLDCVQTEVRKGGTREP